MATESPSGLSYCAAQVRRFDRERYLCTLFAPVERREPLFALYAFNLEIAMTRERVSETMIGMIRLQWWRDAVAAIFAGRPPRHEVAEALARAVAAHGLARADFDRLIDARERDLDDAPPADLDALIDYAEATSATLVRLALEVLDADAEAARRAARHVGVAWALTGLLRAVPFHARGKRLYLPKDRLDAAGVDAEALLRGRAQGEALAGPAAAVAAAARDHLADARRLRADVPRAALPALLPATLADAHLGRLARAGFDPYDRAVQAPLPLAPVRLAWAAARGRY